MIKRRVFIAVNLPLNVKKKLSSFADQFKEFPVKWVNPENLHITLDFIGSVNEEKIKDICGIVEKTSLLYRSFLFKIDRVCYEPLSKTEARMIWAKGKSNELLEIKKALSGNAEGFFPHITLGRIKKWQWQRIDIDLLPEIDEFIDISFNVNSIEVMESILRKQGSEYKVIKSFNLKK